MDAKRKLMKRTKPNINVGTKGHIAGPKFMLVTALTVMRREPHKEAK